MPTPAQTPEEYYSDEDLYGSYQYVTLKDIIDGILMEVESDDDHYLKNIKRALIIRHAKTAIREVTKQVANDVLAFEVTIPESLVWPLPQDYVNYVRISIVVYDDVTGSYRLQPLSINRRINIAIGYLQDNTGEILFDSDGNILQADSLNAIARPYKRFSFCENTDSFNLAQWGEFNIDERRGIISFSSDLSNREVVIEYVSDGIQAELSESQITVHKYVRPVVEDFIYHACIERKRNVPANEKERANRRYKTTLHKAKLAMANFDFRQIARALRTGNVLP